MLTTRTCPQSAADRLDRPFVSLGSSGIRQTYRRCLSSHPVTGTTMRTGRDSNCAQLTTTAGRSLPVSEPFVGLKSTRHTSPGSGLGTESILIFLVHVHPLMIVFSFRLCLHYRAV